MLMEKKYLVAIYVDRTTRQWVVRDPEGHFWSVPSGEDAWNLRQPFTPSKENELEPIPGHYKYMLCLPF
jgi:hypothetical protein